MSAKRIISIHSVLNASPCSTIPSDVRLDFNEIVISHEDIFIMAGCASQSPAVQMRYASNWLIRKRNTDQKGSRTASTPVNPDGNGTPRLQLLLGGPLSNNADVTNDPTSKTSLIVPTSHHLHSPPTFIRFIYIWRCPQKLLLRMKGRPRGWRLARLRRPKTQEPLPNQQIT